MASRHRRGTGISWLVSVCSKLIVSKLIAQLVHRSFQFVPSLHSEAYCDWSLRIRGTADVSSTAAAAAKPEPVV